MSFWEQKKVVVTGGRIYRLHLVERLLGAGADVKVADFTPSERSKSNLEAVEHEIEFQEADLADPQAAIKFAVERTS